VWGAGLPPPAEASAASTVASTAGAASSQNLLRLEHQLAGQRDWQRVTLVRQGSHGIELRGHVQHREALERLVQLPEVAAVAPLVRVVVEQELLRQVQTAVADPALLVAIEPAPSAAASAPLRVVVSGTTRRVGVGAALKLLNIEWGERVELLDRSVYAPEERDRKTVRVELPIRIASVNATERWIESSEGIRYFEGSVVSGYTVEAIEERQVVFKVADRRIEYRLP
jgi:endonuclease YncB( thermonuclease family)